ncbi:MAG: hydrogenase iron-sulfur subunit [Anaerolineae bacterium]|nr:hydrogenase iron-sulfur subunit [Anaerolineae bacterium]
MTPTSKFVPRIVSFLCNWCSYAGADLAGVSRFQYPPTIRVIRVMCSGRVDPSFVVRSFLNGADGVMILGCHPGDCHYATGNYYARNRAEVLGWLLDLAGLDASRLVLDWVSAGEGQRFASLVSDFTEKITRLGPLGSGDGLGEQDLRDRLLACRNVVESEQVRWLVGREREMLANKNVYGEDVSEETFHTLLRSKLADEFLRSRLLLLTAGRSLSVKEMAREMGTASSVILRHVGVLEQAGLMSLAGIDDNSPKYRAA